jgi:hypothetical protein
MDTFDKWGIKKIYTDPINMDKQQVIYMDMDDPKKDTKHFTNWENANLQKYKDGSWYFDGMGNGKGQVRLNLVGDTPFLNTELTAYVRFLGKLKNSTSKSGSYVFQMYTRGGDKHSKSDPGPGSCYKSRLLFNGTCAMVKELQHPIYTGNIKGGTATRPAIKDNNDRRWFGIKQCCWNWHESSTGNTYVHIETWIDDSSTDKNGYLVLSNKWRKVQETDDKGKWSVSSSAAKGLKKSCKYNTADAILIHPAPAGALRTDGIMGTTMYMSLREIEPPRMDL